MRILCIADEFPWPADNGYRIRVGNVVEALAEVGEVDLFVASDRRDPDDRIVPERLTGVRVRSIDREPIRRTALGVVRWAVGRQPREVAWRSWTAAAASLHEFAAGRYDLIWFSHTHTFVGLGEVVDGPKIVDLDNLESQSLVHLAASDASRRGLAKMAAQTDAKRWGAIERRIADEVEVVVLCSDLDRGRLGRANVVVVPNGYSPAQGQPAPRRSRSLDEGALTASMVGLMIYPPNADAAQWVASSVWPTVRAEVPGAELRVVGRGGETLGELGEGITVTGGVPIIEPELARSHMSVIPIRYGGGTRIKLLEAFCHQIPVVSTTVGAEGIDAVHDQHLLIADDPSEFADACVTLLTDDAARTRLSGAAHELWTSRYRWEPIRSAIGALASATARQS